jgi:hypothetical protein
MTSNRNQTVTQTGSPKEAPRKSRHLNQLQMRRAGIEPATYSLKTVSDRAGFWFSPLRTARELVRSLLQRPKSRNSNRHATVTGFPDQPRFPGDVWGWV